MIVRLTALILLCTPSLTQTAEVPQFISLIDVDLGGDATFDCEDSEKSKNLHWYKQSLGHMPENVASFVHDKLTLLSGFDSSRFTVNKEASKSVLIIRNVSKEDEAAYFCQTGTTYSQILNNGRFLAVKDHKQKSVYVKQIPQNASVVLGGSVTLQCSLLSKNKENSVQCPDERRVYWFRAGVEGFYPTIIYTHMNSTEADLERSCAYSVSKIIQNSSDAGTYYCAVVTCGQILFGEGTKVETLYAGPGLDPVFLVLGVLLACVAMIVLIYVCEHCKGGINAPHHVGLSMSTVDQAYYSTVNYAAMDFSLRVKGGKRKRRESPQDFVCAAVGSGSHTQQQLLGGQD